MYVCICRSVTDRQIRAAVAAGAETLDDLRFDLGVATGCGKCASCAQEVLDEARLALCAPPFPALGVALPAFA
jgi:bacterioferritin-associated ferredoxin